MFLLILLLMMLFLLIQLKTLPNNGRDDSPIVSHKKPHIQACFNPSSLRGPYDKGNFQTLMVLLLMIFLLIQLKNFPNDGRDDSPIVSHKKPRIRARFNPSSLRGPYNKGNSKR
jgi:hypothetical protein